LKPVDIFEHPFGYLRMERRDRQRPPIGQSIGAGIRADQIDYRKIEPKLVWIWFGRPIEPRTERATEQRDPPLDQDELQGTLTAWMRRPDGWYGYVEYTHPIHGWAVPGTYRDWFAAERLRPA
jgi:hypothetical protein